MLIRACGIRKSFRTGGRKVEVLKGCSLCIGERETVVLFGESGCGKTTLGKVLLMLEKPDAGEVFYRDVELTGLRNLGHLRRKLQLIPQNPGEALDPRWKIYDSLAEPLRVHKLADNREEELEMVMSFAEMVGLKEEHLHRRPAEVSGGELQRVAIARALILEPEFVVCDEPTSMLDVSVQAAIVRMLMDFQKKLGISYLFITHDFSLAKAVADRMYVMGGGIVVKELRKEELQGLPPESLKLHKLLTASLRP
ncbi:dipeptide/oligopeptide/nickel ABC transporter ATP-binding protein [Archaeoglobus sp.]|uniref:ABC transporter ATP-binding protein n=1 Tax=Archaeoglobus sp. TaxID=1872626 RepID=UPI0024AA9093|nr:dipeptide/oligopeptide/nickel ABC transporter ATP-binding protein [Archaeoglobus sp.]MDI3496794.1 peptide/nickel transport system ATP-binding protein [Archaeoglobus sp.]